MRLKLFVYGSLKRGFFNHHLLLMLGARFVGEAITVDKYTLVDLGAYPGMIKSRNYQVKGELYLVSRKALHWLDRFEVGYAREKIKVRIDGKETKAWCYIYQQEEEGEGSQRQNQC